MTKYTEATVKEWDSMQDAIRLSGALLGMGMSVDAIADTIYKAIGILETSTVYSGLSDKLCNKLLKK